MNFGTQFSPCRNYRYTLTREWRDLLFSGKSGYVAFCCLNPSTADETQNDPTVRRCINFTRDWGYGAYVMLNLFAIRSTDPYDMLRHPDPIGRDNDEWILRVAKDAALFICAWGNHGEHMGRCHNVVRKLRSDGVHLMRLGNLTSTNQPRHPLYLAGNLKPQPL